jgi:hypothetical protein
MLYIVIILLSYGYHMVIFCYLDLSVCVCFLLLTNKFVTCLYHNVLLSNLLICEQAALPLRYRCFDLYVSKRRCRCVT